MYTLKKVIKISLLRLNENLQSYLLKYFDNKQKLY